MKNLCLLLILCIFSSQTWAQRSERYQSRSGRSGYSSPDASSSGGNRYERYQSQPRSERQRFDQNLNKYQHYSPHEKQKAQDKWQSFKQQTTPAERAYIRDRMRSRQSGDPRSGRRNGR